MKYTWLMLASCLVLVLAELVPAAQAGPYIDDGEFPDLFLFFKLILEKKMFTPHCNISRKSSHFHCSLYMSERKGIRYDKNHIFVGFI